MSAVRGIETMGCLVWDRKRACQFVYESREWGELTPVEVIIERVTVCQGWVEKGVHQMLK